MALPGIQLLADRPIRSGRDRLLLADALDTTLRQLEAEVKAMTGTGTVLLRVGPLPTRLLVTTAMLNLRALRDTIKTFNSVNVAVEVPPTRDPTNAQIPFINKAIQALADAL